MNKWTYSFPFTSGCYSTLVGSFEKARERPIFLHLAGFRYSVGLVVRTGTPLWFIVGGGGGLLRIEVTEFLVLSRIWCSKMCLFLPLLNVICV